MRRETITTDRIAPPVAAPFPPPRVLDIGSFSAAKSHLIRRPASSSPATWALREDEPARAFDAPIPRVVVANACFQ